MIKKAGRCDRILRPESDNRTEELLRLKGENLLGGRRRVEKLKSAEAIFSDDLARGRIEDIDEHVFLWMAGEIAGKNFDEVLLLTWSRFSKAF